eukprot:25231-Chlamydomonas_euryale.AAC.4
MQAQDHACFPAHAPTRLHRARAHPRFHALPLRQVKEPDGEGELPTLRLHLWRSDVVSGEVSAYGVCKRPSTPNCRFDTAGSRACTAGRLGAEHVEDGGWQPSLHSVAAGS